MRDASQLVNQVICGFTARRYGKRGTWLMLLGGLYIVFGVGVLLEPAPREPWVLYMYLPSSVQAACWWATGAIAMWQGFRGPDHEDWLGHLALYLGPATRVVSFTLAWLVYLVTSLATWAGLVDGPSGYDRGWYGGLIWLTVSAMLALAASWPNPTPPLPRPPLGARAED